MRGLELIKQYALPHVQNPEPQDLGGSGQSMRENLKAHRKVREVGGAGRRKPGGGAGDEEEVGSGAKLRVHLLSRGTVVTQHLVVAAWRAVDSVLSHLLILKKALEI